MAADTIACPQRSHEAALAEGELSHSSFPLVYLRHKDSGMEGVGVEVRGRGDYVTGFLRKRPWIWTESEKFKWGTGRDTLCFIYLFSNYRFHVPRVWCPLEANKVLLIPSQKLNPPIIAHRGCVCWWKVAICSTSCAKHVNRFFFFFRGMGGSRDVTACSTAQEIS